MDATLSEFLSIVGAVLFASGVLFVSGALLVQAWHLGGPIALGVALVLLGISCYSSAIIWERA